MPLWLMPVWEAFNALSSCRGGGMGLMPIPWTAIDRYAARYGIDAPDDFATFDGHIRAMDAVFLEEKSRKNSV